MGITIFWNIVFVLALSQGVFFGIVLLSQYVRDGFKSQLFLSLFILIFSYILLHNLVYWNGLFSKYPQLIFTTSSTRYLLAPLFYFYYKTFTKSDFNFKDLIHLLPFAIVTAIISPILFQTGADKLLLIQNYVPSTGQNFTSIWKIINWVLAIQLIIYPVYISRRLSQYFYNAPPSLPKNKINQVQWLKFLNQLFALYGILMLIYFLMIQFKIGGIEKDYFISLVMCVAVYGISYIGVVNPSLLKGEYFLERVQILKYKKSKLNEEYLNDLVHKLEQLMSLDKSYLDADFNLNQLAAKLKLPRHHISQALSLKLHKSFHDYINSYPVEHAKMLLDQIEDDKNIKTIMYSSGFNNRVSFNNNFKKYTGLTASEYMKNLDSVKRQH